MPFASAAEMRTPRTYTDPDQVARFAAANSEKNERYLDIDTAYNSAACHTRRKSAWLKDARVLVTGANRGIGLALAEEAIAKGAYVVAACRKASEELRALGDKVTIVEGVEVTDGDSVAKLASALADYPPLDVVVNNAGYFPDVSDNLEGAGPAWDEMKKQYDICAIGPLRVTHALVAAGRVKAPGGKVIMITSQGGSITWRQVQNANEGGDYGHHMCKAAANMCGALLSEELRPKGIAVANLHPGFNRTEMTAKYAHIWDVEGAVPQPVGAKRVWHEVGLTELEEHGVAFINCEDGLEIPN